MPAQLTTDGHGATFAGPMTLNDTLAFISGGAAGHRIAHVFGVFESPTSLPLGAALPTTATPVPDPGYDFDWWVNPTNGDLITEMMKGMSV